MTNSLLHLGVGILGSIIALLMYSSPITTFRRIIRKGSTEDFSGTPYAIALFNCLIYSLYGSPLISNEWDNALVMFVNCIGLVLECCFIAIFLIFAPSRTKVLTARMVVGVVMVFGSIATVSFVAMHDRKHKQFLVGTAGMVATVVLYSAPLSIIKLVIQTKSVEFMPFNLSFFAFAASLLWLAYGFIAKDIMIMAPNFVGLPLGLAQMVIYCIYRGKSVQIREEINDQGDKVFTETTEYPAYPDVEMQLEEKSVTLAHEHVKNSPQWCWARVRQGLVVLTWVVQGFVAVAQRGNISAHQGLVAAVWVGQGFGGNNTNTKGPICEILHPVHGAMAYTYTSGNRRRLLHTLAECNQEVALLHLLENDMIETILERMIP
ncbi:hypothetical protein SUGI_0748240 [Cryptomeria japonica]|nr:hypothetical protein SUGI_0748240 [Cryptomeria japonica]